MIDTWREKEQQGIRITEFPDYILEEGPDTIWEHHKNGVSIGYSTKPLCIYSEALIADNNKKRLFNWKCLFGFHDCEDKMDTKSSPGWTYWATCKRCNKVFCD